MKKFASVKIEPLDNGFFVSAVGLAKDMHAARNVDNNFNYVFDTWEKVADYLSKNIATPEDICLIKEEISKDREDSLKTPIPQVNVN